MWKGSTENFNSILLFQTAITKGTTLVRLISTQHGALHELRRGIPEARLYRDHIFFSYLLWFSRVHAYIRETEIAVVENKQLYKSFYENLVLDCSCGEDKGDAHKKVLRLKKKKFFFKESEESVDYA